MVMLEKVTRAHTFFLVAIMNSGLKIECLNNSVSYASDDTLCNCVVFFQVFVQIRGNHRPCVFSLKCFYQL